MIKLLDERKTGMCVHWLMPKVFATHKWTQLQLSSNREIQRSHDKGITSLCLETTSNRYLLSGTTDGSIFIHDTLQQVGVANHTHQAIASVRGNTTRSAHTRSISMVEWYPHDTGILTSSSMDKTLRIWDTNEMCVVEKFTLSSPIYNHNIARAMKHTLIAVSCQDGIVTICDMISGSSSHVLKRHKKPVMSVKWSPRNENILATGSQDNQILLWDIRKTKGPIMPLDQHNGSQGASTTTSHNGYVTGLQFTSDGLFLISSGSDERLRLWDTSSGTNMLINYGRLVHGFKNQTHHFTLTPPTLSFTPHLIVPTKSDVTMYDLFSGKLITKLKGHYGKVTSVITNSSRMECFTSSVDGTVLVWEPFIERESKEKVHVRGDNRTVTTVYNDTWSDED